MAGNEVQTIGEGILELGEVTYPVRVQEALLKVVERTNGQRLVSFKLLGEQPMETWSENPIAIRVELQPRPLEGVFPADLSSLNFERKSWTDLDENDPDYYEGGTFYANASYNYIENIKLELLERTATGGRARFSIHDEYNRIRLAVETTLTIEAPVTVASEIQKALGNGILDLEDWDLGQGDLEILPQTDRIRIVKLGINLRLNDRGLAPLKRLSGVEELELYQTPLHGDGLAAIGEWSSLRKINLFATGVSDAACNTLGGLTGLETLDLRWCNVTDAGFGTLSSLKNLTRVLLSQSPVGNRGMEALSGMRNLAYLGIDETPVTDDGLAALGLLPSLYQLDAQNTRISDRGLETIAQNCPALRILDLSETATTPEGRARLRKARPDLSIFPKG